MVSSVYLISVCTSRGAILGLIYYFYCFDLTSYISYFYASMKFHVFLLYVCILEFKGATRPSFSSSYLNMSTGIETRCKFLNCLPFLPLSNPFLWLPALSCSLLSFQGGWVDRRKWWHTDVRTYGRIDRKTELNFNRCLQKKKGADTQTDR